MHLEDELARRTCQRRDNVIGLKLVGGVLNGCQGLDSMGVLLSTGKKATSQRGSTQQVKAAREWGGRLDEPTRRTDPCGFETSKYRQFSTKRLHI